MERKEGCIVPAKGDGFDTQIISCMAIDAFPGHIPGNIASGPETECRVQS